MTDGRPQGPTIGTKAGRFPSSIDPLPDANVVDQEFGRKSRRAVGRAGPLPAHRQVDEQIHSLVRNVASVLISPALHAIQIPDDALRSPVDRKDVPSSGQIGRLDDGVLLSRAPLGVTI